MLSNFLSFDKLIGTKLIKILYYLGLLGIVLGFLGTMVGSLGMMRYSFGQGLGGIIMGIVGAVLAVVFWRFLCEIYMLFFRMSDDLRDIKNHQMGRTPNEADVEIEI